MSFERMLDNHTDPKTSLFRGSVTVELFVEDEFESENQVIDYLDGLLEEYSIAELEEMGYAGVYTTVSRARDVF